MAAYDLTRRFRSITAPGLLLLAGLAGFGCGAGLGAANDGGDELDAGGGSVAEVCDGLDNDGDGTVDEGCQCDTGDTQSCYVDSSPPSEGCSWGTQTCGDVGWGGCVDASYPPEGEELCCAALGVDVDHAFYDQFQDDYPPAAMPHTLPELNAFVPGVEGHPMQYQHVNPGDEIIDRRNGGLSETNLSTGLATVRDAAVATIPATGVIVDELTGPVVTEDLGGSGNCFGHGWAWGSVVYQTDDLAVGEIVYLYYGYCMLDVGDGEGFYYSEEPAALCGAPNIE